MPLHSIPVLPSHQPSSTRSKFTLPIHTRKRKRSPSSSPSASSEDDAAVSPGLSAASTNPRSLGPDKIRQYRLAGLELDQPFPDVKGFPHRGLPRDFESEERIKRKSKAHDKGKQKTGGFPERRGEEWEKIIVRREAQKKSKKSKQPLKVQHLSALIAVLHKCLREGDIRRAKRAYGLLLRTQVTHHLIDFRGSGYWALGAELLLRGGTGHPERDSEGSENASEHSVEGDTQRVDTGASVRWGTAEGLAKMKDYLEKLILEYPANVKGDRPSNITALDIWPILIAWEIYGVQYEQKEALRKVALVEDGVEEDERVESESPDAYDDGTAPRVPQRRQENAERLWQKREDIRTRTLADAGKIASRLDELLATPSYMSDRNLLRLGGMMALYIGDLSVPELPLEAIEEEENEPEEMERRRKRSRRLREADHYRGKQKRAKEHQKAEKYFDQMQRADEQTKNPGRGKTKPVGESEVDEDGHGASESYSEEEDISEDRDGDDEEQVERDPSLASEEPYEPSEVEDNFDADAQYRQEIEGAD